MIYTVANKLAIKHNLTLCPKSIGHLSP